MRSFFDESKVFGSQLLDTTNTGTTLAKLSLPAGSYVVNATAAFASGPAFQAVLCYITGSITKPLAFAIQGEIGGSLNSFLALPLTTAFTLAAPEDVSLVCSAAGGANPVSTQPSTMTAIHVATLTDQTQ